MTAKITWPIRIFLVVFWFIMMSMITGFGEQMFILLNTCFQNIMNFIFHGIKWNPNWSLFAPKSSWIGQFIMAILALCFLPGYFKFYSWITTTKNKYRWDSIPNKLFSNMYWNGLMCMIVCYTLEFGIGMLMNKVFHLNAWDYSNMEYTINGFKVALHLFGQINVFYIPIWYGIGLMIFWMFRVFYALDTKLALVFFKETKNTGLGLFTKWGNMKEIDSEYFQVKVDYIEKESND